MIVNQLKTVIVTIMVSLVIILFVFISSPLWADENSSTTKQSSFDDKLAHADKIRSSHPKEFLALVNEFNQDTDNISSAQQHYLDYLNLYLSMYQGKLTEAIKASKSLLNSNAEPLLKFRAKIGLINSLGVNQNWSEGLSTVSSMLAELPSIQDKKTYVQGLLIAAIFYNLLGQYDLGLSYAKQVELTSPQGRDNCITKAQIIAHLPHLF